MSAVRMVAYGVLEMKHKTVPQAWLDSFSPSEREQLRKEDFERDQLRKLVNDELRRYGLLMARTVVTSHNKFRTKNNAHILYGQIEGRGLLARPVLAEGSFKECCIVAADMLDKLDASQVPDKET
jgi:hypothetical protein